MGTTKFTIKISQEEDNSFYAEVVELPGCFSA
jgi:predicted RNase H-like HicB family nuclease